MNDTPSRITYQTKALLLSIVLAIAGLASLLWIIWHSIPNTVNLPDSPANNQPSEGFSDELLMADIYQDGKLLESICLSEVKEPYRITVTGVNDARNEIEIRPGSIGMISASCPDKLCVHQGFIQNSLLPVTCLPNHLVIQVRKEKMWESDTPAPDAITY